VTIVVGKISFAQGLTKGNVGLGWNSLWWGKKREKFSNDQNKTKTKTFKILFLVLVLGIRLNLGLGLTQNSCKTLAIFTNYSCVGFLGFCYDSK
jgi:hypothetical protein